MRGRMKEMVKGGGVGMWDEGWRGWDTGIREWESWGERGRVGCAGDGDLSVEVVRSWLIL
jgi:hypothetical protein